MSLYVTGFPQHLSALRHLASHCLIPSHCSFAIMNRLGRFPKLLYKCHQIPSLQGRIAFAMKRKHISNSKQGQRCNHDVAVHVILFDFVVLVILLNPPLRGPGDFDSCPSAFNGIFTSFTSSSTELSSPSHCTGGGGFVGNAIWPPCGTTFGNSQLSKIGVTRDKMRNCRLPEELVTIEMNLPAVYGVKSKLNRWVLRPEQGAKFRRAMKSLFMKNWP